MYSNFCGNPPISGNYPSNMVVNLETMELTYLQTGGIASTESSIQAILAAADGCAEI
jgi:hypothetical protein